MKYHTEFVLLSGFLSHLKLGQNIARSNKLKAILIDSGFKPVEMLGCYKGKTETSFYVAINNNDDWEIEKLENIAFNKFNQESILVQYSDGHSRLHYSNSIECVIFNHTNER